MDETKPRVTSAALADACHVTAQAVNGWRKTGRVAKRHLGTIAKLTGRPLEYFLGESADPGATLWLKLGIEEGEAIKRLRDGDPDWRRYVLALAMVQGSEQALLLRTMRQAVPDYKVEQAYGDAPHVKTTEKK
jgi:hypothetical protein